MYNNKQYIHGNKYLNGCAKLAIKAKVTITYNEIRKACEISLSVASFMKCTLVLR